MFFVLSNHTPQFLNPKLRLLVPLAGYTFTNLAARSGTTLSHTTHILAGRRSPSLKFLRAWRSMQITERGLAVARELLSEFGDGASR